MFKNFSFEANHGEKNANSFYGAIHTRRNYLA